MLWNATNPFAVDTARQHSKENDLFLLEFKKIIPLLEVRTPKETPARWRGKGISKAHYNQSNANNNFENINLPFRGRGGKKDDDDEEDKRGRGGSNDNGDGDGDRGDDPVQPEIDESKDKIDARQFYGYLFEADKKPSRVLDAMLRGIARYIIDNMEPRDDRHLTPTKLAAFYKSVGGDYDTLFVDVPHASISWIYASIGCQHSFQPNGDDFSPPSVPALTERGFVRWQAIEILLGPEEHVPFIQMCIEKFGIKNPDDGSEFPKGLPKEAFPITADTEIKVWHDRERASPERESWRRGLKLRHWGLPPQRTLSM